MVGSQPGKLAVCAKQGKYQALEDEDEHNHFCQKQPSQQQLSV